MKLDNATRAGKIKLFYLLIPSVIVVSTALVYLVFDSKNFMWAILGGVSMGLFFLAMALFKLYYISFYAGPDKVRLRFKSLSPFPTQNNSIVIDSPNFHDYKVEISWLGKRKFLTFLMQTPGGVAAYPRISISAFDTDEIEQIKKALDLIKQLNKASN